MHQNSDGPTSPAIAHEVPAIDETISGKIVKLDRHGATDDIENPPSKRIKSSSSDNTELSELAPSIQPAESVPKRERRKGVAPIKAESVTVYTAL